MMKLDPDALVQPIRDVLMDITNDLLSKDKITFDPKLLVDQTSYTGAFQIMFSEMIHCVFHHWGFWLLQYLLPVIQMFLMIYSPFLLECWGEGSIVRYFASGLTFSPKSIEGKADIAAVIVFSIITIAEMAIILFIPTTYAKTKHYSKGLLWIGGVVMRGFFPMFLIPFASNVAFLYRELISGGSLSAGNVILILVLTVLLVMVFMMQFVIAQMGCFLLLPNKSPVASYEGKHPALALIACASYIVLSTICVGFERWLGVVIMLCHTAFVCYQIYDALSWPFVCHGTHVFACGLYSATIAGHLVNMASIFGVKLPDVIAICIPLAVFVIGMIVFHFVFKAMVNTTVCILSNIESQTDEERRAYYDSLGIDSQDKFDKMLRIGMTYVCPLIIDWTFMIYASEYRKNLQCMLNCGLFISMFPGEQQASDYFIGELRKKTGLSFQQTYAFYKIGILNNKRFLNDSEDATNHYLTAMQMSDSLYMAIREFWERVAHQPDMVNPEDVESLALRRKSVKKTWKELMAQYPNDSRFSLGYGNFLLECDVDIEDGALMRLKSGYISRGHQSEVDPTFRAFAIAKPRIIKDKVCDKVGNIKRSAFELTQGTTLTISTAALEKLEEDIDSGAVDKLISDLYQWPNLRRSLAKATAHYRPKFYTAAVGITVVAAVLYLVLLAVVAVLSIPLISKESEFFKKIETSMNMASVLSLTRLVTYLEWASENGKLFTRETIDATIPETAKYEPTAMSLIADYRLQLRNMISNLIDMYLVVVSSYADYMRTDADISSWIHTLVDTNIESNTCYQGKPVGTSDVSLKNAITSILYDLRAIANDDHDWTKFHESDSLCSYAPISNNVLDSIMDAGTVLYEEFKKQNLEDRNVLMICLYMSIFISLLVCLPLEHIIIIVYEYESRSILAAMKQLSPDASQQASLQVVQEDDSKHNVGGSMMLDGSESAAKHTWMLILHVVMICLFVVLWIVFLVIQLNLNKKNDDFMTWNLYSVMRRPMIYQATGQVIYSLTLRDFKPDFADANEELAKLPVFAQRIIDAQNTYFLGTSEHIGIKGHSDEIDAINTRDSVCTNSGKGTQHDMYHCLSLDRKISSFAMFLNQVNSETQLDSSLIVDIAHLTIAGLSTDIAATQTLLTDEFASSTRATYVMAIVLIVFVVLLDIAIVFTLSGMLIRLKSLIKMEMILIRRIPPPEIANCEIITRLLLGSHQEHIRDETPARVMFDKLPAPVLTISHDQTIESMNEAAKEVFGFLNGQIVGQKLNCLIKKKEDEDQDISEADVGARKLYEAMVRMQEPDAVDLNASAFVECKCADDTMMPCHAFMHGIRDINGIANNFVIFLRDKREDEQRLKDLQVAQDTTRRLMNQLIPSDVRGFIRDDRTDFTFVSKCSTVVAVQITGFYDLLKRFERKEIFAAMNTVFGIFEICCVRHPPMMRQKQIGEIFIGISGLFSADEPKNKATAAIQFACEAVEEAFRITPHVEEEGEEAPPIRVQVGIATGGPLLCGLAGDKLQAFDAAGQIIEDALYLADMAAPTRVLCCEKTKEVMTETEFESGPTMTGSRPTFYLPNFLDKETIAANRTQTSTALNALRKTPSSMRMIDSKKKVPNILDTGIQEVGLALVGQTPQ